MRALVLGADHEAVTSGRALATQTPGGTGGLRVAADLLRQTGSGQTLWMSEPTWPNHPQMFQAAGFRIRTYPYTDATGRRIDEAAMLEALGRGSPGDIVLLHGACHNPTGVDPSPDLWRQIGDLVEANRLLPLVDLAYQGFGDGLREDAAGLIELVRPGAELLVSTSFSKTFSLYAERVGAMLVIARSAADAAAIQSHVKVAIRVNYSNPPAHGADIVKTILSDADLRARWETELGAMRSRIKDNRRRSSRRSRPARSPATGPRSPRSAACSRSSASRRTRSPGSRTSTGSTSSATAGSTSPASRPPTSTRSRMRSPRCSPHPDGARLGCGALGRDERLPGPAVIRSAATRPCRHSTDACRVGAGRVRSDHGRHGCRSSAACSSARIWRLVLDMRPA